MTRNVVRLPLFWFAGVWLLLLLHAYDAVAAGPRGDVQTGRKAGKQAEPNGGKDPDASEKKTPKLRPFGRNVWLDTSGNGRRVVLKGEVVLRRGALEMLVCLKGTKEHESILAVDTEARLVHAALIVAGAEEGQPVQFRPEFRPASGQAIDIILEWKDKQGKLQRARAQEWVRNFDTGKELSYPWVFAGSGFVTDPETGEKYYLADDGDLICVANFPSATLDLPIESSQSSGSLLFEAFAERIPPAETPVTIYLVPVRQEEKQTDRPKDSAP